MGFHINPSHSKFFGTTELGTAEFTKNDAMRHSFSLSFAEAFQKRW